MRCHGRPVRRMGGLFLCSVELVSLLPQLSDVQVVSVEVSDAVVAVRARTRSGEPAGCTECGQLSEWCHSRYARRHVDVTLAGRPLRIDLSVRRLYCENTTCPETTFAEQVPGLTARYQRRTPGQQPCRSATAFTSGGACPAEFRTSSPPTADACPQPCQPSLKTIINRSRRPLTTPRRAAGPGAMPKACSRRSKP